MDLLGDDYFMSKALQLAERAFEEDEVPIGAVVVHNQKIIGKGYNQTEKLTDVTAHAEMIAITSASEFMGSKFLNECTLYVTVEPCVMCFGAIEWSRIGKVVFGANEPKSGYSSKGLAFNHKVESISSVMEDECANLMKTFFKKRR
jgi:tRNA(adenine34) deaminase